MSKAKKKGLVKYDKMVLYATQNLLLMKDILKTLPSSGINNSIKTQKDGVLEKQQWRTLGKIDKDKNY